MDKNKYDSIISEILKTCSEIKNSDENYDEIISLFSSLLNGIYSEGFRHKYSNISSTIYAILSDSKEPDIKKNKITSNLDEISKKIHKSNHKYFNKLQDYVLLEIQHFMNSYLYFKQLEKQKEFLNKLSEDIKSEIEENKITQKEIEKINQETSNLNNQLVSILGIFTGIIITFFGGVSVISGVLSNMHLVNRFKLVFSISLVGLIIFNIVNSLLLCIGKIINKNLQSTLCSQNTNCAECSICKKKNGENKKFKMLVKKYPFIIFINLIFILIMSLDFLAWLINFSQIK